jgi:tetratricopeptide (TPR) repeat protein
MRPLVMRISRVLVVALLASLAIMVCSARGIPWLGWTLAVGLFSALLGANLLGTRGWSRAAREQRWEAALFTAGKRDSAISGVRRALRKLSPVKQRTRSEHTRLTVLLAELLDAKGEYAEAAEVVDALPLDALSSLEAALVRHTRAVTHLRGSDAQAALQALDGRTASGDLELDQRLSLLESYAKLELGDPPQALSRAAELENQPGIDESVVLEARVVRAAALDALGRKEEALVTLAALGRESLTPLADLGQPRVRALARMVLEGMVE